eukprot:749293-Prorocentrum_minimum.AAC.1
MHRLARECNGWLANSLAGWRFSQAMLIFEGGNWDKSVTFTLGQLDRAKAGPPALNPKSAAIMEKVIIDRSDYD